MAACARAAAGKSNNTDSAATDRVTNADHSCSLHLTLLARKDGGKPSDLRIVPLYLNGGMSVVAG